MDDALVERWAGGDPIARTALRNAIRSTAERVLGHPAFLKALGPEVRGQFSSEDRRRETTGAIADQVMRQKLASAGQVKAMALMTAGRLAVESLQDGRAASSDGGRHVPPAIVMQWTLVPSSVNPRLKEASEKHLEGCSSCREDLRTMDRIVRTLDAVDHDTSRAELAEEAAQVQSALDQTVDLQEAMRSAMVEAREERRSKIQGRSSTGPSSGSSRSAPNKVLPGRSPEPTRSAARIWLPVAVVVLLGAGAVYQFSDDTSALKSTEPVRGVVGLADRSPPEVARIEDLPPAMQQVVADFGGGSCRTAAGRLRGLVRAHPDEPRLAMLEGAAWVCAGDGRKALKILEPLSTDPDLRPRPRQVFWFLAQSHLLLGNAQPALAALKQAEAEDPRHRARARSQADDIRAVLSGS